jgi:hypothetical protein
MVLSLAIGAVGIVALEAPHERGSRVRTASSRLGILAGLPSYLIENRGQLSNAVRY